VIDHDELASLKEFVVETVSQFEMCFPPAFFDIMVHLVGYLTEKTIESGGPFCNRVLKDQVAIGLPPSRHEGRLNGRGRMGKKSFISQDYNTVLEAHHNILHQLSIIEPLIEEHINELCEHNHGHTDE
jgi:hypothetical protein